MNDIQSTQAQLLEQVLIKGDLSKLTDEQKVVYYNKVCESLNLNPLTRPFEYIELNRKLTLYARKECTDQLRHRDSISVTISSREVIEDIYIVTAQAKTPLGRAEESTGCVPIAGLKGESRANAYMKAETKAKRRVTLAICGLGMLDETEVDSISDSMIQPKISFLETKHQLMKDLTLVMKTRNFPVDQIKAFTISNFGKESAAALSEEELQKTIDFIYDSNHSFEPKKELVPPTPWEQEMNDPRIVK